MRSEERLVKNRAVLLVLMIALGWSGVSLLRSLPAAAAGPQDEWHAYGGTNAGMKYSPLDQINPSNVKNLRIAWRQSATPLAVRRGRTTAPVPANYEVTPLMVNGLVYVITGLRTVAALNAETGEVVWHDPAPAQGRGESEVVKPDSVAELAVVPGGVGSPRGVAYWTDGKDARILAAPDRYLIALNAVTGARYRDFGDNGSVDLTGSYDRPVAAVRGISAPIVVGDVVIVGGLARHKTGVTVPGDVRGFDVRTGKLLWTFHTIPRRGEPGFDTWLDGSVEHAGSAGVWGLMTADDDLGYVYLPLEAPATRFGAGFTGDFYGGARPGDNLYGNSLVCLDARTGKRVWHFQTIHHDLWDWDLNAPPVLLDIVVDGRTIKAVAQVSKQSFVYVFNRVTGAPVWPIEERPVPKGDVPGEWYSPTQPHPTKPPAYDRQEVTLDALVDFTPELRDEARRIISRYRYGSLFTPPSMADPSPNGTKGTIQYPGTVATSWNGAGADPETGMLYVPSVQNPTVMEIIQGPNGTYVSSPSPGKGEYVEGPLGALRGPQGLPSPFKPPYGRLVAIDLNKGEIRWTVANGDGPRDHPALKHLNLPPLGQGGRASPLVTKTLVFLGEGANNGAGAPPGSGGKMFRGFDKATGRVIAEIELPGGTTGAPMTYLWKGKQYIVVAVGWAKTPGELVALALP